MNSFEDDITVFAITYFKKQAKRKGMTLHEYVKKVEDDIRKVIGEDDEKMQRL